MNITNARAFIKQHLKTRLYLNSYYLIIGSAVTYLFNFVALFLATRLFSTEAVGLGSAAVSAIGLVGIFSEFGIGIALIRFLPSAGPQRKNLIHTCFTLNALSATLIALIYLVGLQLWSPALLAIRQNIILFLAFLIFTIAFTIRNLAQNVFLALQKAQFRAINDSTYSIVRVAFIVIFALFINNTYGFFLATGLAATVAFITAIYWHLPRISPGYFPSLGLKKNIIKEIRTYSLNNYVARLLLYMPPMLIPLMIVNTLGAEMSARFYVAFSISQILRILPSSVSDSLLAEVSNDETSLGINVRKALKQIIILTVPAVVLTILVSGKLLSIFGQAYSGNLAWVLSLFALSTIPYGINYLYISIARAGKKMGNATKLIILSSGFSLLLGYVLMLKMSLIGMGIGFLTGQSIAAVIVVILLLKKYYRRSSVISSS